MPDFDISRVAVAISFEAFYVGEGYAARPGVVGRVWAGQCVPFIMGVHYAATGRTHWRPRYQG